MRHPSISTDFSELFKRSQKELNSEKFYEAMNMGSPDLHTYYRKCNDIMIYKKKKDQMITICQKYLRFLYTSNEWSKLFSEFDISLLLNYWLYDKVTQIFNAKNTDEINFEFSDLQMVWSNFNNNRIEKTYYDKCRPEPKLVNHEDWENRKKLYDFYVDFNTLFRTGTIYDDVCDEYYQKIKEMIPVCKDFQVKCSTPETYKCPAEYNKCEERDLDFALEQLPCHHKFKGTTVSSSEDDSFPRSTGSEGRIQDPAAEAGTQSESGNAGIREKVTNSVLGATPALLTATMLYRYTPLGPWIRRFGGGRTNNMGAMDTFSHYAPETGEMFSDDPANYISYQPM